MVSKYQIREENQMDTHELIKRLSNTPIGIGVQEGDLTFYRVPRGYIAQLSSGSAVFVEYAW
jgi:hypothetical protein